jgi:hypothetical protein
MHLLVVNVPPQLLKVCGTAAAAAEAAGPMQFAVLLCHVHTSFELVLLPVLPFAVLLRQAW